MENLLEALKSRQIEFGLSLRKVAAEMGVSQPYLSMMFAGQRRMTHKTAKKLEQFLKPKPSATLLARVDQKQLWLISKSWVFAAHVLSKCTLVLRVP